MNIDHLPYHIIRCINKYSLFKPKNKKELREEINVYCKDEMIGEKVYGHINT